MILCLFVGMNTAKILTQIKMPKENARKKAVKPKFHRLSFLKRGDVNK